MCQILRFGDIDSRVKVQFKDGTRVTSEWFRDKFAFSGDDEESDYTDAVNSVIAGMCSTTKKHTSQIADVSVERKKIEDALYVSDHAMDRMRERLGINEKAVIRMLQKINDEGVHGDEVKGYKGQWLKTRNRGKRTTLVYGDFVYIFEGNVLITVLRFPTKARAMRSITGRGYKKSYLKGVSCK